jgi:dihydroorotase
MTGRAAWRGGPQVEVLFTGARVLDPRADLDGEMDVLIMNGLVAGVGEVGSLDSGSATVVDGTGKILMPAFTDPHVHLRTPGQEHKETIGSGTAAAAAGGYCLVLAMPNTTPSVDNPEILRGVLSRASEEAVVPMGQMGAITKGLAGDELTEMAGMAEAGAAGFTDDGMPVAKAGVLRRAFRYQKAAGGVLALHEEDHELSIGASLNEGLVSARLGLRGQPGIAEATMILRDLEIADLEQAKIHIQHVSTAASVRAIRDARSRGVEVTAEASPHHLLLSDEACSTLDSRTKMNPPLRGEDDRLAVIDGLKDGTLSCIATDHAPHAPDEKEQPFEDAPFGTTGLETAFSVLYDGLVATGDIALSTLIQRMTSGCEVFGFAPPVIIEGQPANLVLFDPAQEWSIGSDGWRSQSTNSCFSGRKVSGRIQLTIAEGVVVHSEGISL